MKYLTTTALVGACFITLAACGGGSGSSNSSSVNVTPPPPPPSTAVVLRGAQSGDILLNQTGFQTNSPKLAVLIRDNPEPLGWQVLDDQGIVRESGMSVFIGKNTGSNHTVHHIDFSALNVKGDFYTILVGDKESDVFVIQDRPFTQLAKDSLSYFYQAREGEAITSNFVPMQTPVLTRPASHINNNLSCFAGEDRRGTQWPSCGKTQEVSGGWFDAGDYGRYVNNMGMAAWTMLNLYETQNKKPQSCGIDYKDGTLTIPENNNGVNDLLDEARKGVEFILNMQITDPAPVAVAQGLQIGTDPFTLTMIDATGLAHHKTHGDEFPPFPLRAEDDLQQRYLYAPSTSATLNVAAIGAQCARIWETIDPAFSAKCLSAARTAYAAAEKYPDIYAYDNFFGGGPYDDQAVEDVFGWAASELFITTGEATFEAAIPGFRGSSYPTNGAADYNWQFAHHLGMLSLAVNARGKAIAELTDVEKQATQDLASLATNFSVQTSAPGFGIAYEQTEYFWGSNVAQLNRALVMAQAYEDAPSDELYKAIVAQMDYILGRNPMATSYVTGYGEMAMENPHHRFYANSVDTSFPTPPPGILSGGPNNTAMIDPVAMRLQGNCTGQTCWEDDAQAFSLNEVAINWNASLVWVSGWLDSSGDVCRP